MMNLHNQFHIFTLKKEQSAAVYVGHVQFGENKP